MAGSPQENLHVSLPLHTGVGRSGRRALGRQVWPGSIAMQQVTVSFAYGGDQRRLILSVGRREWKNEPHLVFERTENCNWPERGCLYYHETAPSGANIKLLTLQGYAGHLVKALNVRMPEE